MKMGVPVCLDRQRNQVVCKPGKEPELCDRWIIPGRRISQISRHINQKKNNSRSRGGYAGTTKRKRIELANVSEGGEELWLWENGAQVGSMVLGGGGAFMHLSVGRGGSAGVFLEQTREVLGSGGRKW